MGGSQVNIKGAGYSSSYYCELWCQILTANRSGDVTVAVWTGNVCLSLNKCNSAAVIFFTSPLRYIEGEDKSSVWWAFPAQKTASYIFCARHSVRAVAGRQRNGEWLYTLAIQCSRRKPNQWQKLKLFVSSSDLHRSYEFGYRWKLIPVSFVFNYRNEELDLSWGLTLSRTGDHILFLGRGLSLEHCLVRWGSRW